MRGPGLILSGKVPRRIVVFLCCRCLRACLHQQPGERAPCECETKIRGGGANAGEGGNGDVAENKNYSRHIPGKRPDQKPNLCCKTIHFLGTQLLSV